MYAPLIAVFLAAGVALAASARTLTSVAEIDGLASLKDRALRYDFNVHGTVVASHSYLTMLKDATGICKLTYAAGTPAPGSVIDAIGTVDFLEDGTPHAVADRIVMRGHEPVPGPADVTIGQILRGEMSLRSVRVTGTVLEAFRDQIDSAYFHLFLSSPDGVVAVSPQISEFPFEQAAQLVNAEVRVTGICLPNNGWRSHLNPTHIVAAISEIRTVRPAPPDPFDVPPLDDLRNVGPDTIRTMGQRRIDGIVTAVWSGNRLLVRTDGNLQVRVRLAADSSIPEVETGVQVVGLPDTDSANLILTSARWRRSDTFVTPDRRVIDFIGEGISASAKFTAYDGKCVRIRGHVNGIDNGVNPRLHVSSCGQSIQIDAGRCNAPFRSISPDCEIEATGIFIIETESWASKVPFPRVLDFALVLRSPDDIRIISSPPWWTSGRLAVLIGILLLVLVIILVWNRVLHRIIVRRSQELTNEQLARMEAGLKFEERTRLAVELHDSLSQTLTGTAMEIHAARRTEDSLSEQTLRHLDTAEKTLQSCRDELRNCLWDLRSQALEDPDMTAAVLKTLQPHINDSRLSVRFNVPRRRFSDSTAHAILRIVRELVLNAIRHGLASSVKVAGSIDGDRVLFSVTDNGTGFDPDTCPGVLQGHFGLQGIRERVRRMAGAFTIEPAPGHGTKATVRLPLDKDTSEKT